MAKWVLMSIMKFCIVIKINVLAQEDLSCTVNKENTLQTTIHGIIPLLKCLSVLMHFFFNLEE